MCGLSEPGTQRSGVTGTAGMNPAARCVPGSDFRWRGNLNALKSRFVAVGVGRSTA